MLCFRIIKLTKIYLSDYGKDIRGRKMFFRSRSECGECILPGVLRVLARLLNESLSRNEIRFQTELNPTAFNWKTILFMV